MLGKYKWLEKATAKILFGPDQKAVQRELADHIDDLAEHYMERGMGPEAAETAALEAMGNPEAIAEDLGRLHRPWLGWLWRFSTGLMFAAMGLCLMLFAARIFDTELYLPGADVYDYLTWKFEIIVGEPVERELVPNGSVTTGGYTIQTERAVLRITGDPERMEPWWNLVLHFHIDTGWRDEELFWGPDVVAEIRDSVGTVYGPDSVHYCYWGCSESAWVLGQKAALELNDVPEAAEWVELDIGYGSLMRTLHIDLTEAEP